MYMFIYFFRSTKAAIAFLKSSPKYSQKHIDHILHLTEAEGKKLRPDKYDWQEGGESVPDGWKIRSVLLLSRNSWNLFYP
jgi:hypothetical protein